MLTIALICLMFLFVVFSSMEAVYQYQEKEKARELFWQNLESAQL